MTVRAIKITYVSIIKIDRKLRMQKTVTGCTNMTKY